MEWQNKGKKQVSAALRATADDWSALHGLVHFRRLGVQKIKWKKVLPVTVEATNIYNHAILLIAWLNAPNSLLKTSYFYFFLFLFLITFFSILIVMCTMYNKVWQEVFQLRTSEVGGRAALDIAVV